MGTPLLFSRRGMLQKSVVFFEAGVVKTWRVKEEQKTWELNQGKDHGNSL
jgi:hypothetical protein